MMKCGKPFVVSFTWIDPMIEKITEGIHASTKDCMNQRCFTKAV